MSDEEHFVKPEKRVSVMQRDNGGYRDKTPRDEWMTDGEEEKLWQAHHILCNHSVTEANISKAVPEDDLEFAKDCIWITPWNLNDSHNMLAMPTNWQHRKHGGTKPANVPSHQVDHNTTDGYTDECTKWLKVNVWNNIKAKGKSHKLNAENLKELLKGGSDHFRSQLQSRGTRPKGKGTAHCWEHRFPTAPPTANEAQKAEYKQEADWYFPFSMAKDPYVSERSPGVNWGSTLSVLAEVLKKLG